MRSVGRTAIGSRSPTGRKGRPRWRSTWRERNAGIDHAKLRVNRLARFRAELVRLDYGAALLSDPINIRYATRGPQHGGLDDARSRALRLRAGRRASGAVRVRHFEARRRGLDTVDELRDGISSFYFLSGPRGAEMAERWSREVIALTLTHAGSDRRLAVDRCEPWLARHLDAAGIRLFDAQEPAELARMIKTPEELQCMQLSMDVCDVAVARIRDTLQPGITENQLWAVLHETNVSHDGEWIECRLLASGPRTNPWFQECGNRVIEAGDLVGFDTDMVGPNGYLADISRTLVCPGRVANARQRKLYQIAQEQVLTNISVLRPGMTLREFSERCWPVPDEYLANRYMLMVHGAGMVDEAPAIAYVVDYPEWGYDGVIEENMVLCVESFIGDEGGAEGVKLEEQVVITSSGAIAMSAIAAHQHAHGVDGRPPQQRQQRGRRLGPLGSACRQMGMRTGARS